MHLAWHGIIMYDYQHHHDVLQHQHQHVTHPHPSIDVKSHAADVCIDEQGKQTTRHAQQVQVIRHQVQANANQQQSAQTTQREYHAMARQTQH